MRLPSCVNSKKGPMREPAAATELAATEAANKDALALRNGNRVGRQTD
jgi:hypothetical protein